MNLPTSSPLAFVILAALFLANPVNANDSVYDTKFDIEDILASGFSFTTWGCTPFKPCRASLGDDHTLWVGVETNGGVGPGGIFSAARTWNTKSEDDTIKLLNGEQIGVRWDMSTTVQIRMPNQNTFQRPEGYTFTKIMGRTFAHIPPNVHAATGHANGAVGRSAGATAHANGGVGRNVEPEPEPEPAPGATGRADGTVGRNVEPAPAPGATGHANGGVGRNVEPEPEPAPGAAGQANGGVRRNVEPEPEPSPAEPAPLSTEPAPEGTGPSPQTPEPAFEGSVPAPQAPEPAPEGTVPSPQAPELAPEGAVPAPQAPEPAPEGTVPSPQASEPAPEGAVPDPQAPEPAPEGTVPAPQAPEPAPEAAVPSPNGPEPAPAGNYNVANTDNRSAPEQGHLVLHGPESTGNVNNWNQAVSFCQIKGARLASFDDYCDNDVIRIKAVNGQDQWAPAADYSNAWIQVGSLTGGHATCLRHRKMGFHPEWGMDSAKDHYEANYVLCTTKKPKPTIVVILYGKDYTGHVNNRNPGNLQVTLYGPDYTSHVNNWNQANDFCKDRDSKLASFEDYCMNGALSFGVVEGQDQWAPVRDYSNAWIQVGSTDEHPVCLPHRDLGYDPDLGRDKKEHDYANYILCTKTGSGNPSSYGDPHFITWGGGAFDFHGGCDLVLLQNHDFADGLGMYVHIRTSIKTWWSHIKSAAIQIGDHTLEIMAHTGGSSYWINRGDKTDLQTGDASLGDFPVRFRRVNGHQSITTIRLGNLDVVSVETFKDFVRVNFKDQSKKAFKGSLGLLGTFPDGSKVGRDGKTVFKNADDFGQEWMVRATDALIFHDVDASNLPLKLACPMPTETMKKDGRRRLGDATISKDEASLACARVSDFHRDACIFDVLATQDKDMAGSY